MAKVPMTNDQKRSLPRTKLRFGAGFTLLEVIIAAAVFMVFAAGAYQGYQALRHAIMSARYKALAADLINERFEMIRNLPYEDVGTEGGDPDGVVEGENEETRDNVSFAVITTIVHVDDPFDGTASTGDLFPNDYKLVEIAVSCDTCTAFNPVAITGLVAPRSLESL